MTATESKLQNFWEQYGRILLGLFVMAMLVHDIFGRHGFLAMRQKKREILEVQANIDRLNKENQQLASDIADLRSNPQAIESIARDELNLAKPGEYIIKIPQASPQP